MRKRYNIIRKQHEESYLVYSVFLTIDWILSLGVIYYLFRTYPTIMSDSLSSSFRPLFLFLFLILFAMKTCIVIVWWTTYFESEEEVKEEVEIEYDNKNNKGK